jgi:hypothetical protein
VVALAAVTSLLIAACGSDQPTTRARPKVFVEAHDDSLVVPSVLPSGWADIAIGNVSLRDHEVAFVKLGALPYSEFKTAAARGDVRSFGPDTVFAGGPANVATGKLVNASVHLEPGAYGVACLFRDPGKNTTHAADGMVAQVDVQPSALTTEATPLADGGTIAISDEDFTIPADFRGVGRVAVTNVGTRPHEALIYKVAARKTINDVRNYLLPARARRPNVRAPFASIGGFSAIGPKQTVYAQILLAPGTYVIVDLLAGPDNGSPPNARDVLIKAITIS